MLRIFSTVWIVVLISALGYPSLAANTNETWLVISQHPHDLAKLRPYIHSQKLDGRALTITLNRAESELPKQVREILRPISLNEIRQYEYAGSGEKVAADPEVQTLIAQVSTAALKESVVKLSSVQDRSARARGNQEMTAWAKGQFEALGYATSLHCYKSNECNVVAEKRGVSEPDKIVLVIAHIDSVGAAFAGADDNASGSASALEMARLLADKNAAKTIRFVLANGEENGLVGSYAYVDSMGDAALTKFELVINMDMVGYNSNAIVDIETNKEFEGLAQWFSEKVRTYTRLTPRIAIPAWGSDHVPFLEKDVPTVLTIEHWPTKTPCYHRACDKPETLNYEYAAEITRLNIAVVVEKAGVEL